MQPELFVAYFTDTLVGIRHCRQNLTVELSNDKRNIIVWQKMEAGRRAKVHIFASGEEDSFLEPYKIPQAPYYPHVSEIIDITWEIVHANARLKPSSHEKRNSEVNIPIYMTSNPFQIYCALFQLSQKYNLYEYNALDLGSGTGTVGFVGSHFFKTFTGVEISEELYISSQNSEKKLRVNGSIKNPVNFVKSDFLSKKFDISPFSFIYLFRPILWNIDVLLEKLNETNPGTLVLASMIYELSENPKFKRITPSKDFNLEKYILYEKIQ